MSKVLNINRNTYQSIETGNCSPKLNIAKKIADYFGCTIEEIEELNKIWK